MKDKIEAHIKSLEDQMNELEELWKQYRSLNNYLEDYLLAKMQCHNDLVYFLKELLKSEITVKLPSDEIKE